MFWALIKHGAVRVLCAAPYSADGVTYRCEALTSLYALVRCACVERDPLWRSSATCRTVLRELDEKPPRGVGQCADARARGPVECF